MKPTAIMRMRKPAGAPAALSYKDTVLADAPVAYFRLDELAGNFANLMLPTEVGVPGNTITYGAPSLTQDADDKAIVMAGVGRVNVATTAYKFNSNFTYEAIIKIAPGALAAGINVGVISKYNGGAYLRVAQNTAVGKGRLSWIRSNTADLGSGGTLLSEGVIYHVGVTVSNTGVPTFYLNGVPDGVGVTNTNFAGAVDTLAIGSDNFAEYFQGTIDEVAVYDKALTPARFLAHAQAAGLA